MTGYKQVFVLSKCVELYIRHRRQALHQMTVSTTAEGALTSELLELYVFLNPAFCLATLT